MIDPAASAGIDESPPMGTEPVRRRPTHVSSGGRGGEGADDGFVAFFVAVLPVAISAARRITGDLATAEDAASEAFARAYVRWSSLRSEPYRDAWVLRATTNQAIGALRTGARRQGILRRQPPPAPLDEGSGDDVRMVVVAQVRRLPRRQREVVALRYFAQLPVDATAEALGISPGAVKSHLHRATRTLRERLGRDLLEGSFQ